MNPVMDDGGGVRRRGRTQERQQDSDEGLEGAGFLSASWARRIRKIDVYSKVNPMQESDAQTTTAAGGLCEEPSLTNSFQEIKLFKNDNVYRSI